MASRTIHRKPNGKAYVYSVESYWDREKKAPRNRQKCLGRLDESTGDVVPTNKRPRPQPDAGRAPAHDDEPAQSTGMTTKVVGPHMLLTKVAHDIGLTPTLKRSFPEAHEAILSLVLFIAHKGNALSRCETWSNSHCHPLGQPITSQEASEVLKQITEDSRQHFLSQWLKRLSDTEVLCYDITSISSYARSNEYVRRGYNRDNENLPQINLAMLFGQNSGLPAYYRRLPGNITDTKTLQTTMGTLDFLGQAKLSVVLDRGFYSEKNVDALMHKKYRFFMAVPKGRVWVRDIIDQYRDEIASPRRYKQVGDDEVLYMVSHDHRWKRRRCFVHLYYNASRAADDYDSLVKRLISCKEDLEQGNLKEKHRDLYERYFVVGRTPNGEVTVEYRDDEIRMYRSRYAGFFCILTNTTVDSEELLEIYRRKDVVENCFDDLKNGLDMRRLRIHSSGAMDARLFVQFLALALLSRIRTVSREHKSLKYSTAREIIETMETIAQISCPGRRTPILTEAGPAERNIIDAFAIEGGA